MYGDSQALCSDSGSIFTLNSSNPNSRELFMGSPNPDFDSCGLLRFGLGPGSCFENLSHGVDKNGNNSSGNNGLSSKFNLGGENGGLLVNLEESGGNKCLINGSTVVNSQLPPQYPRKISVEMRQNSSPPGLFSPQNGYAPLRGGLGGNSGTQFYSSEFPFSSWSDSPVFTQGKTFTQIGDLGYRPQILSRHLSLPKTSSAVEKLLQLQETVPCKIRAKRGCATHPRSVAERVRRTRISERMRKLQELVPHMDKQTNTADMLDLAVEYIKDLQEQYKTLDENRANCKCSATRMPCSNRSV